ncbi:hypothetical protein VPH35_020640 [Triticum aestivum]
MPPASSSVPLLLPCRRPPPLRVSSSVVAPIHGPPCRGCSGRTRRRGAAASGRCSGRLQGPRWKRPSMAVDGTDDDQLVSISTEDVVRASRLVNNEICVLEDLTVLKTYLPMERRAQEGPLSIMIP